MDVNQQSGAGHRKAMILRRPWPKSELRPAKTLDHADFGWLKARHHFKVTQEGNPANTPVGSLVVWNDDEIAQAVVSIFTAPSTWRLLVPSAGGGDLSRQHWEFGNDQRRRRSSDERRNGNRAF
jgi:hypothetical protein